MKPERHTSAAVKEPEPKAHTQAGPPVTCVGAEMDLCYSAIGAVLFVISARNVLIRAVRAAHLQVAGHAVRVALYT